MFINLKNALIRASKHMFFVCVKLYVRTIERFRKLRLKPQQASLKEIRDATTNVIKRYEVSYTLNGIEFINSVPKLRGPFPVITVYDEKFRDITERVLPYIGPELNWHGSKFENSFFGASDLYFVLIDGNTLSFNNRYIPSLADYFPLKLT